MIEGWVAMFFVVIFILLLTEDSEYSGHGSMVAETPTYDPRIYDSQNTDHSECRGYSMDTNRGEHDKCPDCGGPVVDDTENNKYPPN